MRYTLTKTPLALALVVALSFACGRTGLSVTPTPGTGTPTPVPGNDPGPRALLLQEGEHLLIARWDAVEGAEHYDVYVAAGPTVSRDTYDRQVVVPSGTSVEIDELPAAEHAVVVTAVVGDVETLESPLATGRPFATGAIPAATEPAWSAEGQQVDASLGARLSGLGDLDGDGYGELFIGAWQYDGDAVDSGAAWVFRGGPNRIEEPYTWRAQLLQPDQRAGGSVVGAGDLNGDGFADLAIASSFHDSGGLTNNGRVLVYFGPLPNGGGDLVEDWYADGEATDDFFSFPVAAAGDVNADGYDDLLVGCNTCDVGGMSDAGRAYLYYGGASAPSSVPWTYDGDQEGSGFTFGAMAGGDLNGDGYSDVVLGAPGYDGEEDNTGRVWAFLGSATGLSSSPDWVWDVDVQDAAAGTSLEVGDLNGDGMGDVIVGVPGLEEGRVFVFHGASNFGSVPNVPGSPDVTLSGETAGDRFGEDVSHGDFDSDGIRDLFVVARRFDEGAETDNGKVYVFAGDPGGVGTTPAWSAVGTAGAQYRHVWSASDVNGDGREDVLVGAPDGLSDLSGEGAAYVYLAAPRTGPHTFVPPLTAQAGVSFTLPALELNDPAWGSTKHCRIDYGDGQGDNVTPCTEADLASLSHTWTDAGSYVLRVYVTNDNDVSSTAAAVVDVE